MSQRFAGRQEVFSPVETGINASALTSALTSNGFGCNGFNQLTLEFRYVKSVGGTLTWFIETSPDLTSSKNWHRLQLVTASAGGVDTIQDHQWSIDLSSASKNFTLDIPLNYENVRVRSLTMVGAAAGDVLTLTARLGVV